MILSINSLYQLIMGVEYMSQENHGKAHTVVEIFRVGLSGSAQSEIGENNFKKLEMLINETIQEERKKAANLVDEVVKTLRKDIDIPELGM